MQIGYTTQIKIPIEQSNTLMQWVGCARYVWNSKVEESEYFYSFGSKFVPATRWRWINKQEPEHNDLINKAYSHFKSDELTPWLSNCPSQILRNSATLWFETQKKFMSGECGRPKKKSRSDGGSIWLTNELFQIREIKNGIAYIFIGSKTNNIGIIRVPVRRKLESLPNSLRIKVSPYGKWSVSFSFDDQSGVVNDVKEIRNTWFETLRQESKEQIESRICGLDRGVAVPVACSDANYEFSNDQKKSLKKQEAKRKFLQRQLARQRKGSKRREKSKRRIAVTYEKQTNVRKDFAHKTTHTLIVKTDKTVFVLENLPTKQMTKSAKGTVERHGKNVRQKSGLNRDILNVGWYRIESYLTYKAIKHGKIVFKVSPNHTSQECSNCEHTHMDNRPEQEVFVCQMCGHKENADTNAAKVIGKRAVKLLLNSGTELSDKGVFRLSNKGRSSRKAQNRKSRTSTTRQKRSAA